MRILVFSDSHGHTGKMIDIVKSLNNIDMIIHLGDLVKDAKKLEDSFKQIQIEYVAGNNDWSTEAPKEKIIQTGNKKGFITHGNLYGVKMGYDRIAYRSQELEVDFALFGHTHVPFESYYHNILLINPGSISLPASGNTASYCLLEVSAQGIHSKIHKV